MRIAVIAWGASIWADPTPWHQTTLKTTLPLSRMENGPYLPLEFSRIAKDGRLTLVIDEKYGQSNTTAAEPSWYDNLESAVWNMYWHHTKKAPKIPALIQEQKVVGWLTVDGDAPLHQSQFINSIIKNWCLIHKYDAAVWFGMRRKFRKITGEKFSPPAAMRYLASLKDKTHENAMRYFERVPDHVRTPTRTLVQGF